MRKKKQTYYRQKAEHCDKLRKVSSKRCQETISEKHEEEGKRMISIKADGKCGCVHAVQRQVALATSLK